MMPTPKFLVFDDDAFLKHEVPEGHPESPKRVLAARSALEVISDDGIVDVVFAVAPEISESSVRAVHSGRHHSMVKATRGRTGKIDEDTWFSPGTYEAVSRAAGGAEALALSLLRGGAMFGVSIGRPPGHHSGTESAMGFCFLNNVAIAARSAIGAGAGRVAIVDWDAHHGNGTQAIFSRDPAVLFASVHNHRAWPFTGLVEEVGSDDGTGSTVNVSLPAKSGNEAFVAAFSRVICPILSEFSPDLILVSAGFDAHVLDPIGGFSLTESGYGSMARLLVKSCPGVPVGLVLEGGYDIASLALSLRASVYGLLHEQAIARASDDAQEEYIRAAEKIHSEHWHLD